MLTEQQQKAREQLANFILDPHQKEIILTGSPGTGKSYLLQDLTGILKEIDALNRMGFEIPYKKIVNTATTNKASRLINGKTIHSILMIKPQKDTSTGKDVLRRQGIPNISGNIFFIDECSMIGDDLYEFIQSDILEKKNKIIYVGDKNQLPPVNSTFNIFNTDIPQVELTELIRFNHEDVKQLIMDCRDHIDCPTIDNFIMNIQPSENIQIVHDEDIADVFLSMEENDRILGHTNKCVDLMNGALRSLKNQPNYIQEGDLVVCKSALPSTPMNRKTYVEEIKTISTIQNAPESGMCYVTFTDASGRYKTFYNPDQYEPVVKELYKKCAKKHDFYEYACFCENVLKLRFCQSATIYSAQGSTYDKVFINIEDLYTTTKYGKPIVDPALRSRLFYVAASRAKEKIYLYYGRLR